MHTSQPSVNNVMMFPCVGPGSNSPDVIKYAWELSLHTDRPLFYIHSDVVFQSSKIFKYMELAATSIRLYYKCCELYYRTPSDKNDSTLQKSLTSKRHRTPDTSSAKRSLIKVTPASHASSCADVYVSVLYLYAGRRISVALSLKLRV